MYVSFLERMRPRRNWRRALILMGVIGVALLVIFLLAYARYFGPVDPKAPIVEFVVTPEDEFDDVARTLKEQGYIRSITAFRIAYGGVGHFRDIREGGYKISARMDTWTIAESLARPPYLAWVTFPPGLRKEQIADLLARKLNWSDEEKQNWILIDTAPTEALIEGVYYGDTYLIPADQEPAQVAARLRGRFEDVTRDLAREAARQGQSWTDVLIMASLIEREAARNDKALVAGILWNRIEIDMPLQVDASLQYFRGTEGNWWPQPNPDDKSVDSPFNTYKYRGLPPHPIANPSLESIEAALNPQATSCLYYLHDSDGQIHCSATYAGQRANVERYLR